VPPFQLWKRSHAGCLAIITTSPVCTSFCGQAQALDFAAWQGDLTDREERELCRAVGLPTEQRPAAPCVPAKPTYGTVVRLACTGTQCYGGTIISRRTFRATCRSQQRQRCGVLPVLSNKRFLSGYSTPSFIGRDLALECIYRRQEFGARKIQHFVRGSSSDVN
jgi:hypothetical protein